MKQLAKLFLSTATLLTLSACSSNDELLGAELSTTAAESSTSEAVATAATTESTEIIEQTSSSEVVETAFDPQDVTDQTIGSIVTYGDYLDMYQKITENYFAEYEEAMKNLSIYDETSYEKMKAEYDQAFEEQQTTYEDMKGQKIIGKDSLVDFLVNYRDGLSEFTDSLKSSMGTEE